MMKIALVVAFLGAISCRTTNVPLVPLRPLQESPLRRASAKYIIAAAPTYWADGLETQLAIQSGTVDLADATAEWSFDDTHISIIGEATTPSIYSTVQGYAGPTKTVIITCWVTPSGGVRERVRALMDIIVTGESATSPAPETETTVITTTVSTTLATTMLTTLPTTLPTMLLTTAATTAFTTLATTTPTTSSVSTTTPVVLV